MTPLNLTLGPPRSPHEALDGLVFLPRSIDKGRAALSGGDSGEYTLTGLTQMMLDTLGVSVEAFMLAVSAADHDDEIASFLRSHATQAKYAEWNAAVAARKPRGGDRAEALATYSWLKDRPDLIFVLDVLEEDDKQHFAKRT